MKAKKAMEFWVIGNFSDLRVDDFGYFRVYDPDAKEWLGLDEGFWMRKPLKREVMGEEGEYPKCWPVKKIQVTVNYKEIQ